MYTENRCCAEAGAIDIGGEHCEARFAVDADEAEQGGEEPEAMHRKDMRLKPREEGMRGMVTHALHSAQQKNAAHGEHKAHLLHHGASLSEDIGSADKGEAQLRHSAHGHQDP